VPIRQNELALLRSIKSIIQREQNEDIFAKFMNDKEFQKVVSNHLLKEVYEKIHQESGIN
jgi:hypothetical protein